MEQNGLMCVRFCLQLLRYMIGYIYSKEICITVDKTKKLVITFGICVVLRHTVLG